MTTLEELEKRKKSVVRIVTKDNDCLLRAITVGIYYHENDVTNRKLRDKIREVCLQKKLAKQLAIKANVPYGQKLDFSHLDKVQNILNDYQIVLIDAETKYIKYLGEIEPKKYWQRK